MSNLRNQFSSVGSNGQFATGISAGLLTGLTGVAGLLSWSWRRALLLVLPVTVCAAGFAASKVGRCRNGARGVVRIAIAVPEVDPYHHLFALALVLSHQVARETIRRAKYLPLHRFRESWYLFSTFHSLMILRFSYYIPIVSVYE